MVKRGICSFPKKIAMAQAFGASVVIIADYKPNEEKDIPIEQIRKEEADGTLTSHIPALEISGADSNKIRHAVMAKKEKVQVRATMETAKIGNKVEVDFWYASSLDLGLKLSKELSALAYSFGNDHNKKPLFTPRIASFPCTNCPDHVKHRNCISNGRYCSFEPRFMEAFNLDRKGS